MRQVPDERSRRSLDRHQRRLIHLIERSIKVGQKAMASGTVADAYLALLADRGIEYLFANAGTDFAPIIESLAKAQATGTAIPKPVTAPHENVAAAVAMGSYLKTHRPQAVMVHVN